MANSHLTQVPVESPEQSIRPVGGLKAKGLLLEVGQPSGTQEAEKEASKLDLTPESLLELTEYVPPTSNLEHAYAFDRQVLFLMLNLNWRETLSTFQFGFVWPRACYFNLENLLVEAILRGDLELEDYGAAYSQIGDFGLRRILYYSKLESDLATRRSTAQVAYEGQIPLLLSKELTKSVGPALTNWREDGQLFQDWQASLQVLQPYVMDTNWVQCLVGNVKARQLEAKLVDYHPSTYVAAFSLAAKRVETNLAVRDPQDIPIFNCSREVEFTSGPISPKLIGIFSNLEKWTLPQQGINQLGDDYYLGKRENLFHSSDDVFPT